MRKKNYLHIFIYKKKAELLIQLHRHSYLYKYFELITQTIWIIINYPFKDNFPPRILQGFKEGAT